MKILISGGTGYIGKNLVQRLLKDNHTVYVVTRPSSNKEILPKTVRTFTYTDAIEELDEFISKEKIEGIIHLAALYIGSHTPNDIKPMFESNILFGSHLIDSASRNNVSWFITTGTQAEHFENKKYSPVNLYAATKKAFGDITQYYSESSNMCVTGLELFETFGPNDPRPKLLNIWLRAVKTGEHMDFPPGMQVVDMCYIDDVVEAYMRLIELITENPKKINGKTFSLITKNRFALRDFAKIFEKSTGSKLNISWGKKPYKIREVMHPWTKGKKLPGWKPKISLEDGIRKIYEQQ